MARKRSVVCQKWEESERGWGTRPDGYSLHLTDKDRQAFIQAYWDRMPDEVPDEYSRPCGTPYSCDVSEKVYKKIEKNKHGTWGFGTPPGSGGTDGWVPLKGGGRGRS